jgi:hypothetical protein
MNFLDHVLKIEKVIYCAIIIQERRNKLIEENMKLKQKVLSMHGIIKLASIQ